MIKILPFLKHVVISIPLYAHTRNEPRIYVYVWTDHHWGKGIRKLLGR